MSFEKTQVRALVTNRDEIPFEQIAVSIERQTVVGKMLCCAGSDSRRSS